MEGGVALFLLVIILVVAAIAGIALYVTGGALTLAKDREKDAVADRPEHEAATSPTQEKVTFAGSQQDPRHREDPDH
jgi:hypothetical protein